MRSRQSLMAVASFGEPDSGSSLRSTIALPAPETPSLSFTIAWLSDGRLARMLCTPATMSSIVWRSSAPTGHRTPSSSNILAAGLAAEVLESWVRAVHRDAKAQRDIPFERCGVVRDQVTAVRVRNQGPDFPQNPWPRK